MDMPIGSLITDERIVLMKLLHEIVADIEKTARNLGCGKAKAYAAGSCKEVFCNDYDSCSVLHKSGKCKYPRYARPPIESSGVNVNQLTEKIGWKNNPGINGGFNALPIGSIYGLVLID